MTFSTRTDYIGWRDSRMKGVEKYVGNSFFKDKSLLEVGCGYADIGSRFAQLGSLVTSSDARPEHIKVAREKYPHIEFHLFDAEKDKIDKPYDIIVHWGLLYHLDHFKEHLQDVSENCKYLFIETEVSDSSDENFLIKTVENGEDQAVSGTGSRPSWAMMEFLLKENNFNFLKVTDPVLNFDYHMYSWVPAETKQWHHGQRCFWICWKTTVPCPLLVKRA